MFAWLVRRVVDGLPSRRAATRLVRVSAQGLHLRAPQGDRVVPWAAIDRVVADVAQQLAGNTQLLVLAIRGGAALTIPETDPIWHALLAALPAHLPGARRAAVWQLELLSNPAPTEVFTR